MEPRYNISVSLKEEEKEELELLEKNRFTRRQIFLEGMKLFLNKINMKKT